MSDVKDWALDDRVVVSDEQIRQYHQDGWVRVDQVLPRDYAIMLGEQFLAAAARAKKEEAEASVNEKQNYAKDPAYRKQHILHREKDLPEEFKRAIRCRRVGSIAAQIMGVPQVQMFRTTVFEKLPQSGGGGETTWHQDFPYLPVDRSGSLTIWIALSDLPAEAGTMQYVPGSHREGNLGRDRTFANPTGYDRITELKDRNGWTLSAAPVLKAGDATVHHDLTVHAAGVNNSTKSRLGLGTIYMDSRSLFTAAPNPLTDGLPLKLNHPFDPDLYPILPN